MGKTLAQLAIKHIVTRTEFRLLDVFHKEIFKCRLSKYYINYTLDLYNSCKDMGKIAATKYSLVETMETMVDDYAYNKASMEKIDED